MECLLCEHLMKDGCEAGNCLRKLASFSRVVGGIDEANAAVSFRRIREDVPMKRLPAGFSSLFSARARDGVRT